MTEYDGVQGRAGGSSFSAPSFITMGVSCAGSIFGLEPCRETEYDGVHWAADFSASCVDGAGAGGRCETKLAIVFGQGLGENVDLRLRRIDDRLQSPHVRLGQSNRGRPHVRLRERNLPQLTDVMYERTLGRPIMRKASLYASAKLRTSCSCSNV